MLSRIKSPSRAVVLAVLCLLSACGGGGGDSPAGAGSGSGGSNTGGAPGAPPTSAGTAPSTFGPDYSDGQATLSALSAGRTAWNTTASARVTLKSSPTGQPVSGALRCVSDVPAQLEVAADCSTVKGLRLGVHSVTVTGGGASAKALVKVIPQPQPLGVGFTTVDGLNIVAAPDGRPLIWGNRSNANVASRPSGLTVPLPDAILTRDGRVLGGMVATGRSSLGFVTLSEDGEVYSWGNPRILGRVPVVTGSEFLIPSDENPAKVTMSDRGPALQHVVAISMGHDNVMALTDEGQVYVWGGFKGDPFSVGEPGDRILRLLALPDKAVAVAAGQNWCIVLLANGRVMTVVSGGEGYHKEAGRPATPTSFSPGFVVDRAGQPLEGIVSIAAGTYNGFAVNQLGQVWAWGKANFDELGQGVTAPEMVGALLVRAPDGQGYLSGITMVAAGNSYALALHRNSQVYSWGYNYYGQLGDGKRRTLITRDYGGVPGLVLNESGTAPLSGVRAVDAGMNQGLALGADGLLRIWGSGGNYALGQGSVVPYSYLPLLVRNEAGNGPLSFNPMSRWPNLTAQ